MDEAVCEEKYLVEKEGEAGIYSHVQTFAL